MTTTAFIKSSAYSLAIILATALHVRADQITAKGSDSTLHLVRELAKGFESASGHQVKLSGGGSGKGIQAVKAGEVNLAFSSKSLKPEDVAEGLVPMPYAIDAVAIIVHKDNPLNDLARDELKSYFNGSTTKWPNGTDVVVLNRLEGSGTREFMQEEVIGKGASFAPGAKETGDAALNLALKSNPSAIAYTSAGDVDREKVKVLTVNGVEPSAEAIKSKTYPLVRQLTMATKGEPTQITKEFLAFVRSDQGTAIIEKTGYTRVN